MFFFSHYCSIVLFAFTSQVSINSRGLVYSVILLLASVFLTVSTDIKAYYILIYKGLLMGSINSMIFLFNLNGLKYILLSAREHFWLLLFHMNICSSSSCAAGSQCASESLETWPEVRPGSYNLVCHLSSLLYLLWAAVGHIWRS